MSVLVPCFWWVCRCVSIEKKPPETSYFQRCAWKKKDKTHLVREFEGLFWTCQWCIPSLFPNSCILFLSNDRKQINFPQFPPESFWKSTDLSDFPIKFWDMSQCRDNFELFPTAAPTSERLFFWDSPTGCQQLRDRPRTPVQGLQSCGAVLCDLVEWLGFQRINKYWW